MLIGRQFVARVEEESSKITNQLFVKGASNATASTSNNNDEPLGAATFVSVVSKSGKLKDMRSVHNIFHCYRFHVSFPSIKFVHNYFFFLLPLMLMSLVLSFIFIFSVSFLFFAMLVYVYCYSLFIFITYDNIGW